MSRRAVLRSCVVALALGAMINIIVTAWCVYNAAARPRYSELYYWDRGDWLFIAHISEGSGKSMIEWWAHMPITEADRTSLHRILDELDAFLLIPPAWSTLNGAAPTTSGRSRTDIAFGWPCLSFRGGITRVVGASPSEASDFGPELPELSREFKNPPPLRASAARRHPSSGITGVRQISARLPARVEAEARTVPLTPVFPGVIVNTAVYAGAWWLVFGARRAVRVALRARRGQCPGCGYDRRGLASDAACPECGNNSQERERRATAATVGP